MPHLKAPLTGPPQVSFARVYRVLKASEDTPRLSDNAGALSKQASVLAGPSSSLVFGSKVGGLGFGVLI